MFGKRSPDAPAAAQPSVMPPPAAVAGAPSAAPAAPSLDRVAKALGTAPVQQASVSPVADGRSEEYYKTKSSIYNALIETIDLGQLAALDQKTAREEIREIVNEIVAIKQVMMSVVEQEQLLGDIVNDVLGYGPLEPLLARDDIADVMVNGAGSVFIEVNGKVTKTGVRFRDNQQLMNICQRIVSQVGR
ncbi:MAG: hypothetical protein RL186_460, partial [Pseudomonadota bacterium]